MQTEESTLATLPEPFAVNDNLTSLMLAGGPQFEHIQRVANLFAKSDLVPAQFQNKIGNCIIALEMAQRMGAGALPVMQNLYLVHGKPGWSSQFLIASLNTCGRFEPLRFDVSGKEKERTCIAWTTDKGVRLPSGTGTLSAAREAGIALYESPPVSIQMAHDEGWYGKNGSKWKTMPELMLRYRAATFFTRLYAPEITMGMRTVEEINEIEIRDVAPKSPAGVPQFLPPSSEEPQEQINDTAPPAETENRGVGPEPQNGAVSPSLDLDAHNQLAFKMEADGLDLADVVNWCGQNRIKIPVNQMSAVEKLPISAVQTVLKHWDEVVKSKEGVVA